ncbi:peptidase M30-like protein [Cupriavidus metallidurans]|jgi:Peptidase M30|uniref:M30 family zinc metallopeptidase n=2 Tax=Cupriavidus metallidurans TaxID=119219 RepID=UPI000493B211|nr:hemagglutinin [Cupriavidus metallidurans]KWW37772.1 Neutral metalloprotease [Cupriavidus metallidurans]MDE4918429.1 hemagglutinin [Cupriavidus metallidurans]
MTNKSRTSPRARYAAVALLAATALSACGGGGDGYQSSQPVTTSGAPSTPEPSPPKPTNVMTPACSNCGAVDADTYAGTGVGVWKGINATADTVDMPIRISGLKGQDVTLIFTNHTGIARTMPNISLTTSQMPSIVASALRWDNDTQETKRRISDFNREGWVALAGKRGSTPYHSATSEPTPAAVHDVRTWYHSDNSERSAMLVRQLKASDGTTINFWVEGSENDASKVSPDIVARLADSFASEGKIYDMLKSVGGPFWGQHAYFDVIPATGQPIDIVILNFDHNDQPFGGIGYFYGRNAIKKAAKTNPFSNESVSLYLDAETLYLGGEDGMRTMLLTMAHEAVHAQNFYRRGMLMGPKYSFDEWLEEASAMMMEDLASLSIDANYNAIRDVRFRDYLGYKAGSYNCSLTTWTPFAASCDSYSVSGSLGGFLNRQLGLDFYKNLLTDTSSSSVAALDSAIRSVQPESSLGEQLRRFGATSGALMKSPSPAGFGFPERQDGPFTLPLIDPQALLPVRTLTQSIPATLEAYANLPVVRSAVSGTYSETVKVPAGSTLSVVIQ